MLWNTTAAVITVLFWGVITFECGGLCILGSTNWSLSSPVFTNPEVRQKTRGFLLISTFLGLSYLIMLQWLSWNGFPAILGITIVVEFIVATIMLGGVIILASGIALVGYVHHR